MRRARRPSRLYCPAARAALCGGARVTSCSRARARASPAGGALRPHCQPRLHQRVRNLRLLRRARDDEPPLIGARHALGLDLDGGSRGLAQLLDPGAAPPDQPSHQLHRHQLLDAAAAGRDRRAGRQAAVLLRLAVLLLAKLLRLAEPLPLGLRVALRVPLLPRVRPGPRLPVLLPVRPVAGGARRGARAPGGLLAVAGLPARRAGRVL
mmetsp:Transcript_15750/g.52408  ORF Transcript_15750/g.52408 Transcript_15750/m.52408 type:complete len:209 (-) Transcript_15750:908-1534(-)